MNDILKGGQGRTEADVFADTMTTIWALGIATGVILTLAGVFLATWLAA